MLSLVKFTAFRLESKSCKGFFLKSPPMRALEFITGHVIYNSAYTNKFQLKPTFNSAPQSEQTNVSSESCLTICLLKMAKTEEL